MLDFEEWVAFQVIRLIKQNFLFIVLEIYTYHVLTDIFGTLLKFV